MKINACTFASDVQFHFVRVSIYSFIQNNQWFDGTVYLLVHPDFPISNANLAKLQMIYSKIEIIQITQNSKYLIDSKNSNISNFINSVNEFCKIYFLSLGIPNLLYFSNSSLIVNSLDPFLIPERITASPERSIIYQGFLSKLFQEFLTSSLDPNSFLDSKLDCAALNTVENLTLDASEVRDNKFNQFKEKINLVSSIFYNPKLVAVSSPMHRKILQVWLHKNNTVSQWLSSPRNFNISNSFQKKINISSNSETLNGSTKITNINNITIDSQNLFNYLNNKKIAIVANSSDLLNYPYGSFIDSHDVVIRFNGYAISSTHTGIKTNVHAVFREARFNLENHCDYLMVFSKPLLPWQNSISEIKKNYPSKKIINYNFPSDSQIMSNFRKNIILTSGMCAIFFIDSLNLKKYELNLFGFNGYSNGLSSIFRSNESTAISNVHNYKEEMKYLNRNFNKSYPSILQKIKE